MGGTTADYDVWGVSNIIYAYDTVSDSWSQKTNLASARGNANCVRFNDIAYYLGGRTAVGTLQTLNDGYVSSFNTLTTGSTETALPTGSRMGTAGVVYAPSFGPARMIIIGGSSNLTGTTGSYLLDGVSFNATTNANSYYLNFPFETPAAWQAGPIYENNVFFASAVVADDVLYCFGGAFIPAAGTLTVYNDTNALDLTSFPAGTWTAKTNMPTGRFGHVALKIKQ